MRERERERYIYIYTTYIYIHIYTARFWSKGSGFTKVHLYAGFFRNLAFPDGTSMPPNIPMNIAIFILKNQPFWSFVLCWNLKNKPCWDICWFVRLYVYVFWLLYPSNNFPFRVLQPSFIIFYPHSATPERALHLPPRSKSKFCAVTSDFSNTPSAIWATCKNFVPRNWKPENGATWRSICSVEWIASLQSPEMSGGILIRDFLLTWLTCIVTSPRILRTISGNITLFQRNGNGSRFRIKIQPIPQSGNLRESTARLFLHEGSNGWSAQPWKMAFWLNLLQLPTMKLGDFFLGGPCTVFPHLEPFSNPPFINWPSLVSD